MPINLDEVAVTVFKNILDENHDNIITPNEAAQGINQHLLPPIIRAFPGIQTDSMINPASLGEFLNENGTLGDGELKALLEQYFEFLANKTTNPAQNIIAFQNEFNNYYTQQQQPENFDMEVDEDDFNNPAINPAAVNHGFDEQGATAPGIVLNYQLLPSSQEAAAARGATASPTAAAAAPGASARGATASPAAPARRLNQPPSAAELYPDDHPGPRIPSRSWPNAPPGYLSRRWREENGWPVDEEDAANRAPPHSWSRRWLVEHGWPVSEENELLMARHLSREALEGTNRNSTAGLERGSSSAPGASARGATASPTAAADARRVDAIRADARRHLLEVTGPGRGLTMSREDRERLERQIQSEPDEDDQLQRAIALSLEDRDRAAPGASARGATAPGATASPAAVAPKPKTLAQINETIQVFDPYNGTDVPVSQFLVEQSEEGYKPFIVRASNGKFSGDAIGWATGKEYIECKDNTPSDWQGNTYGRWIKNNARRFIKINISGSPTLIVKPAWYDTGLVPGTKYFSLVKQGTVNKFMSTVLSSQNLPQDFTALGAEHCNQIPPPVGTYVLEPISLSELNTIVNTIPAGGKKNRKSKSKNLRKIKNKYNKFTRKGIKKNKIIIKINKLNKKQKTRKGYKKNKKQTSRRKK
jgi:hypothetical protein